MAPLAHIVHFTDPGCPWAWNAEPRLLRLRWRYRDQLSWETVMVGLAESEQEYLDRGFTAEVRNESNATFARDHEMPISTEPARTRVAATAPACRAVVAAQLHAPDSADALLRALRVRNFAGGDLDDRATIDAAAGDCGLGAEKLARWSRGDDVSSLYTDAVMRARTPSAQALAQPDRLASWAGGLRYTAPSLEVSRVVDGMRLSAPGFQSYRAYELVIANLMPAAEAHADAQSVAEVLAFEPRWPLATAEVAAVRGGIALDDAAAELRAAGATEHASGSGSYWSAA